MNRSGTLAILVLLFLATTAFAQGAPKKEGTTTEALVGLCCVCGGGLVLLGIVGGGGYGVYYLMNRKPPDKYPNPIDISGPLTYEKFGVHFKHPKVWKPHQEKVDGLCMMSEGPLLFFCIQVMPSADVYMAAYRKEAKQLEATMTPQDFERMVVLNAVGYGATLGAAVLKSALEMMELPMADAGEGKSNSQLCGRQAWRFPFTVQDGAYTGECRATVVGNRWVIAVWMVWASHLDRWRPGVDLVLKSLAVAEE